MPDAIDELRRALEEQGKGHARIQPRMRTRGGDITLSTMGAILPHAGVCGAKIYSTHAGKFDFVIPLFSNHDGRLLSIVHGDALTEYRTAAVTRIASDLFARADARVLAVFGTGLQARAHIRAMVAGSAIERILIVGIERVAQTIEEMQIRFPGKRFEASDAQAAVAAADIIVTATRSTVPLFNGAWARPGAFVAAIGSSKPDARELDDAILARAGTIVVESLEQARLEAGDLLMARSGILDWGNVIELGHAVLNGTSHSGVSAEGITVFKSLGFGLADVALAHLVLQRMTGERMQ